ncbi:unnamed protein product [Clonostachys rhizophaga]|uniref:PARP catalytic domain-containing protein n=1 Tax=Clonostachys rhizophaga TaxID=160324 RepID=A0A9N9YPZ1_9HYPO|nr:unnamed protein product [Clonostachys rhizophaga]
MASDFDEDELIQLAFLRDEETDALISAGLLSEDLRLTSPLDDEVVFSFEELVLTVTSHVHYPVRDIDCHVENINLPREVVDVLRRQLKQIMTSAQETNNLKNWQDRENGNAYGVFEPVMAILQLAQTTAHYLAEYRSLKLTKDAPSDDTPDEHLWFLPNAKQPVQIASLVPSSTTELAYRLLHTSPKQVAALIPGEFRVVHVEQVLRTDLARDFEQFQSSVRRKLSRLPHDQLRRHIPVELRSRRIEDMVDHLVKPRLTFHGTQCQNVPSIVRHGFVAPGARNPEQGAAQKVRCGSTYGRGIYSSPSAAFSLTYSDGKLVRDSNKEFSGLKLIVCATIMGRPRVMFRDDEWRAEDKAWEGADSHVANGGMEYIVFDAAQIIPVYVVHLDWGADNAEHLLPGADSWGNSSDRWKRLVRKAEMAPGDRQRAKEAVFARAAKYFPYGYGPASGKRFVVEEVGEVSDDEENYGDYQNLEEDETAENTEFWSWVKAGEMEDDDPLMEGMHNADEYLEKRHALVIPQGFARTADAWDSLEVPKSKKDETGEKEGEDVDDDDLHLDLLMMDLNGETKNDDADDTPSYEELQPSMNKNL